MVAAAPRIALLVLAACSGNKARGPEDAGRAAPRADAAGTVDAAPAVAATGELVVRVEWKDVPAAVRASPGRTACNTPRAPAVAPTTTWGIPDVFVLVEGTSAKPADARVTLADCALAPRVAAGTTLLVDSAVSRPASITLARHGTVADPLALAATKPRAIQLPIAGHTAQVALEPGGIYQLATTDPTSESAWLVAGAAATTDAAGVATIRALPVGTHRVTAWLPPRSGHPARIARGEATITADAQAELTLALVAP